MSKTNIPAMPEIENPPVEAVTLPAVLPSGDIDEVEEPLPVVIAPALTLSTIPPGGDVTLPKIETLQKPVVAVPTAELSDEPLVEDDRPVRTVIRPDSEGVTQNYPVLEPLADPWNDDSITLPIPAETRRYVEEVLNSMSEGEQQVVAENERWIQLAGAGLADAPLADMNAGLSGREGSEWRQAVPFSNRMIGITRPPVRNSDNAILRGAAARIQMRSHLGMGTEYRIPLWHSGFWITVRSPGEDALIELDRRLSEEKITLGRSTTGLLYSNASVFNVNHVTQFVLDQMVSTTLKNGERANVERMISIHDIQTLAWGLACSVWPNGFQYARAVLGETPDKNRVIEGKVNVSKLQWTDTGSLTDAQIAHMAAITTGAMTDESVLTYQRAFTKRVERRVELRNGTALTLQVPSLAEHVVVGQRWVNDIVVMTDRVFGMDQDADARRNYISTQGKATMLRQYAHWIKYAEFGTSSTDQETRDEESLAGILDDLSSDDQLRDAVLRAVIQYAEDTTVSFIAVPTVDEREENIFPRHPHLLPIDALSVFFTLLNQKLQLILTR